MSIFVTPPLSIVPGSHTVLQPQLIVHPAISGSVSVGAGAGSITYTGTPVGVSLGQGIGVGAGAITYTGLQVGVVVGGLLGINVSPGTILWVGTMVGIQATTLPTPTPTPTPVPTPTPTPTPSPTPTPVPTPTPAPVFPYQPTLSDLSLDVWERCGVQAGALTTTQFQSMRRSMNLVLSRWANRGINLWKVNLVSEPCVVGQASYAVDPMTLDVLDTYVTVGGTDLSLYTMSRNEYAALPNKTQAGRPTSFWYDRLESATVTLWPVPDSTYTLNYYQFVQIGAANPTMGNTPDVPYAFLEAYTAGVAAHLSIKWAPERAVALDTYAKETWTEAAEENREKVTMHMSPQLSGYFS